MDVDEAEARLLEILKFSGFDSKKPDLNIAWRAFKKFVAEPVECADDGILFQTGCYDFTGERLFYFEFVRQFSVTDEDGEYEHMEQLHLEFTCTPTPELMTLETNLWAYDFPSKEEYFNNVESLKEFKKGLDIVAWNCEIYQEMV